VTGNIDGRKTVLGLREGTTKIALLAVLVNTVLQSRLLTRKGRFCSL
jgi:hypothetical protein